MVDEVVSFLQPVSSGWFVDATFGGGGHTRALLDRHRDVRIVAVDRDPDALREATTDERIVVVADNYRNLAAILDRSPAPDRVDGILFDLGVSSHQLDEPGRGFSYRLDGPLDMRMGPDAAGTAADLVNGADQGELTDIIRRYGEDPFASRIAAAIVGHRPFSSTTDLARCVADAVPAAARRSKHPARKTFQAIRIAVNDELAGLSEAIEAAIGCLVVGGRIVVMSYHSLEDRIVKVAFRDHARTCTCPPGLPVCRCGATPDLRLLTRKAIKPSPEEVAANPRARSAVLRAAERIST
jgi:16S rRNA (cytosine1402-N4)-methyltransferase